MFPDLSAATDIASLAEALASCGFDDIFDPPAPKVVEAQFVEMPAPLKKVAESPWRSLGGFFDYANWKDRERFLELDRAIASGGFHSRDDDRDDFSIPPAA